MSQRAAELFAGDMKASGPVRLSEVDKQQRAIMRVARGCRSATGRNGSTRRSRRLGAPLLEERGGIRSNDTGYGCSHALLEAPCSQLDRALICLPVPQRRHFPRAAQHVVDLRSRASLRPTFSEEANFSSASERFAGSAQNGAKQSGPLVSRMSAGRYPQSCDSPVRSGNSVQC
ncbi:FliG C-terminal domain-containing protein [Paraburkholderia sp. MPAMCS5]|uniref:FliG C-terminal domain-containing protein n=1 Tax=Paraburkholderia sp. MPAMCS5 TaxID=3112563 RepID=UPI002E1860C4|nr:FliG C-terminal domain-containing protein [Paraburkholderia sp. MPAMCS5]